MIQLSHKNIIILIILTLTLTSPKLSHSIAIDFLGQVANPLIGPAKDKAQGMFRFLWAQPYAGYALGSGVKELTDSSGGLASSSSIAYEGFMYGGRGGILLFRSVRIGADFTQQLAKRKERSTDGTDQRVGSKNTMLGASLGFDIPKTPLQAFGARYFTVNLEADTISRGTGYGTGVSFILSNPIILLLEYRWFNIASEAQADGSKTNRTMNQYYLGFSFMLI